MSFLYTAHRAVIALAVVFAFPHGALCQTPTLPPDIGPLQTIDAPRTGNSFLFPPTPTPSAPPSAASLPTLTAGQTYTLTWTNLVGTRVQLALRDSFGATTPFAAPFLAGAQQPGTCQGFRTPPSIALAGTCALISNVTQNLGRYVWDIPAIGGGAAAYNDALKRTPHSFWIQLNVEPAQGEIWVDPPGPPWQESGAFWIVAEGWDGTALDAGSAGGGGNGGGAGGGNGGGATVTLTSGSVVVTTTLPGNSGRATITGTGSAGTGGQGSSATARPSAARRASTVSGLLWLGWSLLVGAWLFIL